MSTVRIAIASLADALAARHAIFFQEARHAIFLQEARHAILLQEVGHAIFP